MSNLISIFLRNLIQIGTFPLIVLCAIGVVYGVDAYLQFMKDLGVHWLITWSALMTVFVVVAAVITTIIDRRNDRKAMVLAFLAGKPNIEPAE